MSGRFKSRPKRPEPERAPVDLNDPKARQPRLEEVNPHIPKFIAKAPWYLETGVGGGLEHQRRVLGDKDESLLEGEREKLEKPRGMFVTDVVTKFRKGACTNCGSMTHKVRDCMERPRKTGARWTGQDIRPDEMAGGRRSDLKGFEAKRDRWIGYDADKHLQLAQEWDLVEEERKRVKEREIESKLMQQQLQQDNNNNNNGTNDHDDKQKLLQILESGGGGGGGQKEAQEYAADAESADMPGQKVDLKTRMTIRNLRLREDTAKYLKSIGTTSSQIYDPKTRAMRDDPNAKKKDTQLEPELFVRYTGETPLMQEMQVFAWSAYERGSQDVHAVANPSQAEAMYRQFKETRSQQQNILSKQLLEQYGEQPNIRSIDSVSQENVTENIPTQTDLYVEYKPDGSIKKQRTFATTTGANDDDDHEDETGQAVDPLFGHKIYVNNHQSEWGSWTDKETGSLGYSCCHSTIKNSYCIGLIANQEHEDVVGKDKDVDVDDVVEQEEDSEKMNSVADGDGDEDEDEQDSEMHKRYRTMGISKREMDQYRQKRILSQDPMAAHLKSKSSDASNAPLIESSEKKRIKTE